MPSALALPVSVEGELTVDPSDPASVQVGEIRIDARDLTTDDDRRTNRLRNDILKSSQDAYRYITFRPTSIDGLPAAAAAGDSFTFQSTGDLTILDTTQPVTFEMTVTAVDEETLQGSGTATIRYADFGINIPRVPMVASVEDEVMLEIDFSFRVILSRIRKNSSTFATFSPRVSIRSSTVSADFSVRSRTMSFGSSACCRPVSLDCISGSSCSPLRRAENTL